jgi:hypothetical protein
MISIWVTDGVHTGFALLTGLIVGGCHFLSLRYNGSLFGRGYLGWALTFQVARVGATSIALFALARFGPLSLLAGLVGLILARRAALRTTLLLADHKT